MNVVAISQPDRLTDLAGKINSEQEAAFNAGLDALEHFAKCGHLLIQAKKLVSHGEWMPWLEANTEVGQRAVNNYMRLAENWDAIAPQISNRVANIKDALKLIAKPKPKPTPDLPPVTGDEPDGDFDYEGGEEEHAPGELPNSMRIRGFLHRAKEAKEMAEADDMSGIKVTNAMRTAASNAAKAWIELLAKLEGE
jgi:hypothetical protein